MPSSLIVYCVSICYIWQRLSELSRCVCCHFYHRSSCNFFLNVSPTFTTRSFYVDLPLINRPVKYFPSDWMLVLYYCVPARCFSQTIEVLAWREPWRLWLAVEEGGEVCGLQVRTVTDQSGMFSVCSLLIFVLCIEKVSEYPGSRPGWPYLCVRTAWCLHLSSFIFSPAVSSLLLCAPLVACLLPLHLCLLRHCTLGSSSPLL